jgi:predicted RNase H-like HicB family nuclease
MGFLRKYFPVDKVSATDEAQAHYLSALAQVIDGGATVAVPFINLFIDLSEDEAGGYMGQVRQMPGVASNGPTVLEALANTIEALIVWMDADPKELQDAP